MCVFFCLRTFWPRVVAERLGQPPITKIAIKKKMPVCHCVFFLCNANVYVVYLGAYKIGSRLL